MHITLILRIFIDMKHLITIIGTFVSLTLSSQDMFFEYDIKEPTKIYYENGELKEIGLINGEKRVGKWIFYSEKGIKLAQCCFNNYGSKTWRMVNL